jgi:hypothetical protein
MATRFYLLTDLAATAPSPGEKSTALPVGTFNDQASGADEGYALSTSIGTGATGFDNTTLAQTGHQDGWLLRHSSPPLAAQTVNANTWTIALSVVESNNNANAFLALSVYLWRPGSSSVVGYIYDSDTPLGTEWTTTQAGQVITFSGSSVTAQDGDLLVLEVWEHATQGMTTSYTVTVYINGTTAVTAGGTETGSYLETPQTLTFSTATAPFPPWPPPCRTLLAI